MTPLRSARQMLPGRPSSPEEALRRWNAQPGVTPLVERPREGTVLLYASQGRWVADCDCGSGMALFPETSEALCLNCGSRWKAKMPARDVMEAAERALDERPPERQDWDPWRTDKDGKPIETPEFLRAETKLMWGVPVGHGEGRPGNKPERPPTVKRVRKNMAVNIAQLNDEIEAAVADAKPRPFEDDSKLPAFVREMRPGHATVAVMGVSGGAGVGWVQVDLPDDASDAIVAAVASTIEAHRPKGAR